MLCYLLLIFLLRYTEGGSDIIPTGCRWVINEMSSLYVGTRAKQSQYTCQSNFVELTLEGCQRGFNTPPTTLWFLGIEGANQFKNPKNPAIVVLLKLERVSWYPAGLRLRLCDYDRVEKKLLVHDQKLWEKEELEVKRQMKYKRIYGDIDQFVVLGTERTARRCFNVHFEECTTEFSFVNAEQLFTPHITQEDHPWQPLERKKVPMVYLLVQKNAEVDNILNPLTYAFMNERLKRAESRPKLKTDMEPESESWDTILQSTEDAWIVGRDKYNVDTSLFLQKVVNQVAGRGKSVHFAPLETVRLDLGREKSLQRCNGKLVVATPTPYAENICNSEAVSKNYDFHEDYKVEEPVATKRTAETPDEGELMCKSRRVEVTIPTPPLETTTEAQEETATEEPVEEVMDVDEICQPVLDNWEPPEATCRNDDMSCRGWVSDLLGGVKDVNVYVMALLELRLDDIVSAASLRFQSDTMTMMDYKDVVKKLQDDIGTFLSSPGDDAEFNEYLKDMKCFHELKFRPCKWDMLTRNRAGTTQITLSSEDETITFSDQAGTDLERACKRKEDDLQKHVTSENLGLLETVRIFAKYKNANFVTITASHLDKLNSFFQNEIAAVMKPQDMEMYQAISAEAIHAYIDKTPDLPYFQDLLEPLCEAFGVDNTTVAEEIRQLARSIENSVDFLEMLRKNKKNTNTWTSILQKVEAGLLPKGEQVVKLVKSVMSVPVSTASVERGFSQVHHALDKRRSRLLDETLDCFLTIRVNGPPIASYNPAADALSWVQSGRWHSDQPGGRNNDDNTD